VAATSHRQGHCANCLDLFLAYLQCLRRALSTHSPFSAKPAVQLDQQIFLQADGTFRLLPHTKSRSLEIPSEGAGLLSSHGKSAMLGESLLNVSTISLLDLRACTKC